MSNTIIDLEALSGAPPGNRRRMLPVNISVLDLAVLVLLMVLPETTAAQWTRVLFSR